jgi:hypothetical protein
MLIITQFGCKEEIFTLDNAFSKDFRSGGADESFVFITPGGVDVADPNNFNCVNHGGIRVDVVPLKKFADLNCFEKVR